MTRKAPGRDGAEWGHYLFFLSLRGDVGPTHRPPL